MYSRKSSGARISDLADSSQDNEVPSCIDLGIVNNFNRFVA